jgi:hypothetical protein
MFREEPLGEDITNATCGDAGCGSYSTAVQRSNGLTV